MSFSRLNPFLPIYHGIPTIAHCRARCLEPKHFYCTTAELLKLLSEVPYSRYEGQKRAAEMLELIKTASKIAELKSFAIGGSLLDARPINNGRFVLGVFGKGYGDVLAESSSQIREFTEALRYGRVPIVTQSCSAKTSRLLDLWSWIIDESKNGNLLLFRSFDDRAAIERAVYMWCHEAGTPKIPRPLIEVSDICHIASRLTKYEPFAKAIL